MSNSEFKLYFEDEDECRLAQKRVEQSPEPVEVTWPASFDDWAEDDGAWELTLSASSSDVIERVVGKDLDFMLEQS